MQKVSPLKVLGFAVTLRGLTPMIQHRFSSETKANIREKQQNPAAKTRKKVAKDPEADYRGAMYTLADGRPAVPVTAIKGAMIEAAHKDLGIPKTVIRKSVFFEHDEAGTDGPPLVVLETPGPKMREDVVRVGMGSTDLRYRPEFTEWSVTLVGKFDSELIELDTIYALLERAGFGVGLGEWRPEKGGEYGRFEVVLT